MALTFTEIAKAKVAGGRYMNAYTVTFDSSYALGGEAVTANNVGLGRIDALIVNQPITGHVIVWDSTASKLRSFVAPSSALFSGSTSTASALSESTTATDLSTVAVQILAIGL